MYSHLWCLFFINIFTIKKKWKKQKPDDLVQPPPKATKKIMLHYARSMYSLHARKILDIEMFLNSSRVDFCHLP